MPMTWVDALRQYSYPVNLSEYRNNSNFPGFFESEIDGDRDSTKEFEDHFRSNAANNIAAWLEIVYWKLYSIAVARNNTTDNVRFFLDNNNIEAEQLYNAVDRFIIEPAIGSYNEIRTLLGISSPVLAVVLTFPAFLKPHDFPMVDKRVASWVINHYQKHNKGRTNQLTPFKLNRSTLQTNNFNNYINWVKWCREMSTILTSRTSWPEDGWRARDVEMAVFAAKGSEIEVLD